MIDGKAIETRDIQPKLEVDRERLLIRLSEGDRNNLEDISRSFAEIMTKEGMHGGIVVVGGVMEKPLPRKDIDVRVVLETEKKREDYKTYLEFAKDMFRKLQTVVGKIAQETGSEITEELEPAIDEEYQNPSILKHEGTIKMTKAGVTPVEFLHTIDGNIEELLAREKRPFCVLVRN